MQLGFPLELNRDRFEEHLLFLKDCRVEQVPLYFMVYNEDAYPMEPGNHLNRMLDMFRVNLDSIRSAGLESNVLYIDFRLKPADVCANTSGARDWFESICRTVSECNVTDIGFFPNNPVRETITPAWDEAQVAGYRAMAEIASSYSLRISAHINMSKGSRYDRIDDIDELFLKVGADNFGLLFCFGCIALAGLSIPEMIHHWRERIFIVHLRDVIGTWDDGNSERQFGTGKINLSGAITALREIGYSGILHPEHFPIFETEPDINARPFFDHPWDRGAITTAWTLGFWRGMLEKE